MENGQAAEEEQVEENFLAELEEGEELEVDECELREAMGLLGSDLTAAAPAAPQAAEAAQETSSTSSSSSSSSSSSRSSSSSSSGRGSGGDQSNQSILQRRRRPATVEDERQQHDSLCVRKVRGGAAKGFIKEQPNKTSFYATCYRHTNCVKTRTYATSNRIGSGRPLGYLAAWIWLGEQYSSKKDHMAACPDYDTRLEARRLLLQEFNVEMFTDKEAGITEGDDIEPRVVPR